MRLKILLFLLPLFLFCFNGFAQTKKPSNAGKPKTQQTVSTTATREVGKDGYIWYKLKRGNLYGARDIEGNTIIPVKYKEVSYYCSGVSGTHCFYVKEGDFQGAYTRKGTMVVSPERHYVEVRLNGGGGKICWVTCKNGSPEKVLLDAKGNELFSIPCEQLYLSSAFDNREGSGIYSDVCYISVKDGEKYGIYDLNGNEIVPLQRKSMYLVILPGNKISLRKYNGHDGNYYNETDEEIEYDGSTRYNYTPYEELYYEFKENRSGGSSTSSSSSSATSSTTSSSSSTTTTSSSSSTSHTQSGTSTQQTIVVEHKHDPQPMQVWQQCYMCGGSGNCNACWGSGIVNTMNGERRCWNCGGRGRCTVCAGQGGHYEVEYR